MECTIRCWEPEDALALAGIINNRKIQDNLRDGLPYPYTVQDAAGFIAAMRGAAPGEIYSFAILHEDTVVGSINLSRKTNIHRRTAEMGYYLAEPYWGRVWMTDVVRQVCAFAFEKTDLLRLFAEPFADNTASCRVLEKAGFTLEGVMRKNAVKNGAVRDMKLYALVRD